MKIYESPFATTVDVPPVDAWEGLLGNTTRVPDGKTFVVDALTGKSFSFGESRQLALQLADGLRNTAGFQKGDVICLFSPNSILYPIVCQAAQAANITVCLANPNYTPRELLHVLSITKSIAILASSDVIQTALETAKEANISKDNIYALPGSNGKVSDLVKSWEVLKSKKSWKHQPLPENELATTPAFLPCSSGTTGMPKAVNVSHENVVSMNEQLVAVGDLFDQNTVMLGVLPFMHIYALTVSINQMLRVGGTLIVLPRFDFPQMLQAIGKYKVTKAPIVPPIALALARHPLVDKADLSSLVEVICGAAPMSGELTAECSKRIGCPVFQGFGMTETTAVATLNRANRNQVGSVGCLVPGQQARIVQDDGEDAPDGSEGEIWLRGKNIVRGYYNNQQATSETITADGWLKTGDIGHFKNGHMYIVDRKKELIKVKGNQVAPAELEALLLGSDLVADTGVIGVYSEEDVTEYPLAYVVLTPKGQQTKDVQKEIQKFVASKTARWKHLKGGVKVVEAIPKNASGKILRKDLRKMHAEEQKTKAKL